MEMVIWLVLGLVAGAAIGAVSMWWWNRSGGGGENIAELKRENEKFRNEVTEHFVETAQLINQLTDSYKAVFDHLSSGADKLVDDKALAERMPRVSSQEVRLRHLGTPEKTGLEKSASGKGAPERSAPQKGTSEDTGKRASEQRSAASNADRSRAGADPLKNRRD